MSGIWATERLSIAIPGMVSRSSGRGYPLGHERLRSAAVIRGLIHRFSVRAKDGGVGRVAEAYGVLHDRVEHQLRVGVSAANHTKNFTRCRLLVEGLGQLMVVGLPFLE